MENLSNKVGPGTAGIAQRIYKNSVEEFKESLDDEMYVLRSNSITKCGHNQY